MKVVKPKVFLGGACGSTTWRQKFAIPMLEAAGVDYFDPQIGIGEWTEVREPLDMKMKAESDVLLFVVNGETRGVAGIAEAAFYLGTRRPLALVVTDVGPEFVADPEERDDLNRGRIFLRTMAAEQGVPVFNDVESATRYAIELAVSRSQQMTSEKLRAILDGVEFKSGGFSVEEFDGGFLIQLWCEEQDVESGERRLYSGRKWHIEASATESEIVRTAFKAVMTWQEHETREGFVYRGSRPFNPHFDVRREDR